MSDRRILRIHAGAYHLAREAPFPTEEELHRAVAEHPEVLPADELGLGPLVGLASELDLGSGPMDLFAVDPNGRAVIVEFKRGTENPDVRKVVAQLLDYGSALWRKSYDELEEACLKTGRLKGEGLAAHVAQRLEAIAAEPLDEDAFRTGLSSSLDSGDFVFLYVARDMDARTRRIMTFLGEGPRLSVFAVEVDRYAFDGQEAVLVPRTAFVPSWVNEKGVTRNSPRQPFSELMEAADEAVRELDRRLTAIATELGCVVGNSAKARHYRPAHGRGALSLYPSWGTAYFLLSSFRRRDEDDLAEEFRQVLGEIFPDRRPTPDEPGVPVDALLAHWDRAEKELIRPYLEHRLRHVTQEEL